MSNKDEKTQINFTQPKDKSHEAFVAWLDAISAKLGASSTLTEEEKRKYWREFWDEGQGKNAIQE